MMYLVTWRIDIEADSPREAARMALDIQRDPDSIATVFEIRDSNNRKYKIDLDKGGDKP